MEDIKFEDESVIHPNIVDDNYTYVLLDHKLSRDQPGTYKIVEEFRAVLDEYTNRDGNTRYQEKKIITSWVLLTICCRFKLFLF